MFGWRKKQSEPEPEPLFTPGSQEPEPEQGMVLRGDMTREEMAEEIARWTDTPVEEVNPDDWWWRAEWWLEEGRKRRKQ